MISNHFPFFSPLETRGSRTVGTAPLGTTAMCAPLGTTGRWPAPLGTVLHVPVPAAAPPGEPAQVPTHLCQRSWAASFSASFPRLLGWPVLTNLYVLRKAKFKRKCSLSQYLKRIFSKAKSLCWYWGVQMEPSQERTFRFCFSENNFSLQPLFPACPKTDCYWVYE